MSPERRPVDAGPDNLRRRGPGDDRQHLPEVSAQHDELAAKRDIQLHDVPQCSVHGHVHVLAHHGRLVPDDQLGHADQLGVLGLAIDPAAATPSKPQQITPNDHDRGHGEAETLTAPNTHNIAAGTHTRTHLHVAASCILTGILKREWAVLPPSISRAAMPEEATASATFSSARTVARSRLYTKVLPVPPGPYRNLTRACHPPMQGQRHGGHLGKAQR